ncbi:CobW family GTP-binding protein [Shewanella salipaludis]|uniref:GTP-binding protein n=1 Tax=Shewanella salipaludis TaxID=2723052 RepID=A0A972JK22_9GAMM|nr:GTP-binding protein [Shewanella salipaludis]NMH64659.1 GTP-binding protein [Shewanella salipaludis]
MIVQAIATNVITGFLGVGKTSLITRLLANKPSGERWAVLVNEFGEVGIDAGLLDAGGEGIEIREVAGGCICCAAGVPTQVAINQLIAKARPDRLLIEPTGLGHPLEIIKLLSAPHYHNVLSLRSTLCLIDARKVSDERYRGNDNFMQQLQAADLILASKTDLYCRDELLQLQAYLDELGLAGTEIMGHSREAPLDQALLEALDRPRVLEVSPAVTPGQARAGVAPGSGVAGMVARGIFAERPQAAGPELDERGMARKLNAAEGYFSCGWLFEPAHEFDFDALLAWIESLKSAHLLRLKAVMITRDGIAGFNLVDDELSLAELDDTLDSRLEIIASKRLDWQQLESGLLACRLRP